MKKLFLLIILCTFVSKAQDVRFTAGIYTELADKNTHNDSYDYGFNLGVHIEYQMTVVYFDFDMFLFPDLNKTTKVEFQATCLGFNHHSRFQDWRFKLGVIKPGLIKREGYTYPMMGSDFGIERYFGNFYIGGEVSGNWKSDDKYWDPEGTGYYQVNAGLKLGICW